MASSTQQQQLKPSSATEGFFQSPPVIPNQFHEDPGLKRALALFLPAPTLSQISPDLSNFGAKVLTKEVLDWVSDAERNSPWLKDGDPWGKEPKRLIVGEGWRRLQDLGIREGIVAAGYEEGFGEGARVVQFAKYHLWAASSAFVNCPSAMQDGAARAIQLHLRDPTLQPALRTVLQNAFSRLTTRDPAKAWTSGQWMTERIGGSDISKVETLATYSPSSVPLYAADDSSPLGPWLLNGHKWFTSATDSGMSLILARIPDSSLGTSTNSTGGAGLSLFFAPTHKHPTNPDTPELNGIQIHRLKNKLGTRAVPTAELSLHDTRAYLLGPPGHGIREIATVLNITRIHNSMTALGLWGRGLAASRAFTRVRTVAGGKPLNGIPLHTRTLATQSLAYRANLLLTFLTVSLLGSSEHNNKGNKSPNPLLLLRILTPLTKALTAKAAITGLQECMESLGGVGYLENIGDEGINIARLFRDSNVLAIWEGTTDVLATDIVRTLKHPRNGTPVLSALATWLDATLPTPPTPLTTSLNESWSRFHTLVTSSPIDSLSPSARTLMTDLHHIICGALLVKDAARDGDPVAQEVARRWVLGSQYGKGDWKEEVRWDKRVLFGDEVGKEEGRAKL